MINALISLVSRRRRLSEHAPRPHDTGQSTLEYIAMIELSGLLVLSLVAFFSGSAAPLVAKVQRVVSDVLGI